MAGTSSRASRTSGTCYLPGPHRGVFNGIAAKTSQTLFITESYFGRNGAVAGRVQERDRALRDGGWTADHEKLLREHGATEVYLCLDNDEAGADGHRTAKRKILPALVKQIHVVQWPEGVKDAADFFLSRARRRF